MSDLSPVPLPIWRARASSCCPLALRARIARVRRSWLAQRLERADDPSCVRPRDKDGFAGERLADVSLNVLQAEPERTDLALVCPWRVAGTAELAFHRCPTLTRLRAPVAVPCQRQSRRRHARARHAASAGRQRAPGRGRWRAH